MSWTPGPGVWATDPLNRKQPDIILERQEIRKIYFYHLFFIICFFPCYESEFDLITLNLQEYRDWRSEFQLSNQIRIRNREKTDNIDIGLINLIIYSKQYGICTSFRGCKTPEAGRVS